LSRAAIEVAQPRNTIGVTRFEVARTMRRTDALVGAQLGGGALSPPLMAILAARWCPYSCCGEIDGLPAKVAFVALLVATVTMMILAAGAAPDGDYTVMGFVALLFGFACVVLWLTAGQWMAWHARRRAPLVEVLASLTRAARGRGTVTTTREWRNW
jgi:hypothetical protein